METLPGVDTTKKQWSSHQLENLPSKVILIGLGVILMIGAAVLAGTLYKPFGYATLGSLAGVPIGLILIGFACRKQEKAQESKLQISPQVDPWIQAVLHVLKKYLKEDKTQECALSVQLKGDGVNSLDSLQKYYQITSATSWQTIIDNIARELAAHPLARDQNSRFSMGVVTKTKDKDKFDCWCFQMLLKEATPAAIARYLAQGGSLERMLDVMKGNGVDWDEDLLRSNLGLTN